MTILKNAHFPRWWHKGLLTVITYLTVLSAAAAQAPTPTVAPTRTPKPLKIGVMMSLSGLQGDLGGLARNGIELAREEFKDAGAEVIFIDLASNPDQANLTENFKKLVVSDQVSAIIGDVTAPMSVPLALHANTYRVPYILPAALSNTLPPDGEFSFTMYPRMDSVDKAYQHFFDMNGGIKSIALFCSSSEQGFAYVTLLRAMAASKGARITDEVCGNENSYNFQVSIMRANGAKPDAMFFGFGIELGKRWMDSLGVKTQVLGTDDVAAALELRGFPENEAEGVYYVDWNLNDEFSKAYQAKYNAPPIYLSYLAYESFRAIVRGREKSPYDIRAGLRLLKYPGASGEINFQNDQAVNFSQGVLKQVRNGRGVVVP